MQNLVADFQYFRYVIDCSPIILLATNIFNLEKKSHLCHILLIYLDLKHCPKKTSRAFSRFRYIKTVTELPCLIREVKRHIGIEIYKKLASLPHPLKQIFTYLVPAITITSLLTRRITNMACCQYSRLIKRLLINVWKN